MFNIQQSVQSDLKFKTPNKTRIPGRVREAADFGIVAGRFVGLLNIASAHLIRVLRNGRKSASVPC